MLTPKQVAELLGITTRTLDNWRTQHKGPPFFKMEGFIRYSEDELKVWLEAKKQLAIG